MQAEQWLGLGLILIIVGAIIVPIVGAAISESADEPSQLSAYGDSWSDISNVRRNLENEGYGTKALVSSPVILDSIEDEENTLFLVSGVEKRYSSVELDKILQFVEDGGKLILAGDYGYENDLSTLFGIYFYGKRIVDREYDVNRTYVYSYAALGGIDYKLTMSSPTGLQINSPDVTIIARSGNNSYVDIKSSGIIDIDAFRGPVPTIAEAHVGKGIVVVISDASFFLNGQWGEQNGIFIKALFKQLLPQKGTVIFDESRHNFDVAMAPTLTAITTVVLVFNYSMLYIVVSVILIAIIIFAIRSIKAKEHWGHQFNILKLKKRRNMERIKPEDIEAGKAGMFARIGNKLGLTTPELNEIKENRQKLNALIKDERIVAFLTDKRREYDVETLNSVLIRFRKWENE